MGFATRAWLPVALSVLAGCGGGGGGGGLPINPPAGGNSGYTQGIFPASSTLANQCASPRAGTSDRTGSTFTENMFLRSWTNELYLWYRDVPDRDPSGFTTENYFNVLKTSLLTSSGRPKDQFHFTYPTAAWESLSQSGVELGYGAQWTIVAASPPRKIIIAYVEPGTPATAASANLSRGAEVLLVDGVDAVNANTGAEVDVLNDGLFPDVAGRAHTFRIREGATIRDVTMTPVAITHAPVLMTGVIDPTGVPVGYMVFNDHIATAESALINSINQLRAANVQDLVLDLRYNGGGYLDIASELAYMIAGGSRTSGQTFERLVFNDKNPNTNPITGQALSPTPFHTTAQGFDTPRGTPLPTLNLNRVYVITGTNTCSASESIINSLRGVGIEVYQIGSTTCGKPYGFYPQNNCGTTYFSVQFQGLNAAGFGDYADGFAPQNSTNVSSARLNGCAVADDYTLQLGDVNEGRLRAALAYRASNNQTCPAAVGTGPEAQLKGTRAETPDGVLWKTPMRENRILSDGSYEPPSSATRVRMLHTPEPRE